MEEVALVCEVDPGTFLVPCLLPPAAAVETAAPQSFVLDFGASFLPDTCKLLRKADFVDVSDGKSTKMGNRPFLLEEKKRGGTGTLALQGQPLPTADLLCSAEIQSQRPAETLRVARLPIVRRPWLLHSRQASWLCWSFWWIVVNCPIG